MHSNHYKSISNVAYIIAMFSAGCAFIEFGFVVAFGDNVAKFVYVSILCTHLFPTIISICLYVWAEHKVAQFADAVRDLEAQLELRTINASPDNYSPPNCPSPYCSSPDYLLIATPN